MSDLITAMRMGDAIPEWLLVAEPMEAGAPRGNWRFTVDVHIVDTPDYFVVVPMALGQQPPLIDNAGMVNHRIYATSKPVHTITGQHIFFPEQVNAWHGGTAGSGTDARLLSAAEVEALERQIDGRMQSLRQAAADAFPQPGFLRRLWRRIF